MRRAIAAAGAALAAGALLAAPTSDAQAVKRVTIKDFKFQPQRIVVHRGTRIVWTNTDSDPHTISSKTAHWASQALDTGQSFSRVAHRAGTFHYICTIHPFMHGTVTVK